MTHTFRKTRTTSRRGFALPLVVMLALVSSLIVAVMLDRSTTQARTVKRQLDAYRDDHFAKGMQEAIDSWMKSVASKPMSDVVEEDGHAMDLELAGGVTLKLYIYDGQGSILTDFALLQGDSITDAQGVAMAFETMAPDEHARASIMMSTADQKLQATGRITTPSITRRYGSPAVSVNSAPDQVIAAVANYAGAVEVVPELLEQISVIRSVRPLTQQELTDILNKLRVEQDVRAILQRLYTTQPTFWQLEARLSRTGQSGPPEAAYSGYSLFSGRGNLSRDRSSSAGMTRLSVILDWKRVADR